jgi:hypothetical protein
LWSLLAQDMTQPAPEWLNSLGPFVAFGVLAVAAIVFLARLAYKLWQALTEERSANRELFERLITQAERMIPILEAATRELERRP